MILHAITFFILLILNIILIRFLKTSSSRKLKVCKFKISKVKYYQSVHNRKFANFSVNIRNNNAFFLDFPISFKFYSDQRFKSKVRISYSTVKNEDLEEILNKTVQFETKTKEYDYYINDVIVGKIDVEIELLVNYGDPIIEFEILKNNYCELTEVYKKVIKFPK